MGDGRVVRIPSPASDGAGKTVDVTLNDNASMSIQEALALIAAKEQEITASLSPGENLEMSRWKLNEQLIELLPQCPELFQQMFDAENGGA